MLSHSPHVHGHFRKLAFQDAFSHMEADNCAGTAAYMKTKMAAIRNAIPPIGLPSKDLKKEPLLLMA
jgi:hypothetical protein